MSNIILKMNNIKELKKKWIYNKELYPIKIYCSNFSKHKLWIIRCNKNVLKFILKYIPEEIMRNIWIDKEQIIYINFKNKTRLKKWNQQKTTDWVLLQETLEVEKPFDYE